MGLHDLPHARRPFVGVLVLSAQFEHLAFHRSDHLPSESVAFILWANCLNVDFVQSNNAYTEKFWQNKFNCTVIDYRKKEKAHRTDI